MPRKGHQKEVVDLTRLGYNPRQISVLLGIATQNVYKNLKKAGIKPAKGIGT